MTHDKCSSLLFGGAGEPSALWGLPVAVCGVSAVVRYISPYSSIHPRCEEHRLAEDELLRAGYEVTRLETL